MFTNKENESIVWRCKWKDSVLIFKFLINTGVWKKGLRRAQYIKRSNCIGQSDQNVWAGTDAIKKFTPSLGIPSLGF